MTKSQASAASGSPTPEEIQEPARIHEGHQQTRQLSKVAGGPMGWVNTHENPLMAAYYAERIDSDEYHAGAIYQSLFEKMGRKGRDSTQLTIVGGNTGLPFTQTQVDAIRAIEAIEANLDGERRIVIRQFCGHGQSASKAIQAAGHKNPREVWDQMRVALNKLATAIARAKHIGRVSYETPGDD